MALTERSRHKLYETFADIVGDEEAVEEMLSYFPARDVEEPVTKDHLRAEMSDLRTELRAEMSDLRAEMGDLRAELRAEMSELRAEMGDLRAEMGELRSELHVEIAAVRTEVHQMARTMQTWTVGTGISLAGLMLAITRFG